MIKQAHDIAERYDTTLDQILALTVLLNDDMSRDLTARGLTRSRTHVLWLIHHQGPMSQRNVADALGVSARNITGLVDGLQNTGFATRQPHPTDRRAALVTLTDRGTATANDLQREHHKLAQLLFADMPPRHFDELSEGIEHILKVLHRETAPTADGEPAAPPPGENAAS